VALCRTSEDRVGEAMMLVTARQSGPTCLGLPSRCNAVKPPSSADIFSIAFGSAMDARGSQPPGSNWHVQNTIGMSRILAPFPLTDLCYSTRVLDHRPFGQCHPFG
jgi:hypothetical protein